MAAVDYFLKLDGIDGESTDAKHKGEIQLLSFSWGEQNSGGIGSAGCGPGAGRVSFQDFHFSAQTSIASPKLMLATANGGRVRTAMLTARKAGRQSLEFLKVTLTDVLVSSYHVGEQNGDEPTDEVSLNFARIEFSFAAQRADGTLAAPVRAGWDLATNKTT